LQSPILFINSFYIYFSTVSEHCQSLHAWTRRSSVALPRNDTNPSRMVITNTNRPTVRVYCV